jgi:hypothetical protein
MRGTILPLPQYVFMAWCSFKAQGQLYLIPSPFLRSKYSYQQPVSFFTSIKTTGKLLMINEMCSSLLLLDDFNLLINREFEEQ